MTEENKSTALNLPGPIDHQPPPTRPVTNPSDLELTNLRQTIEDQILQVDGFLNRIQEMTYRESDLYQRLSYVQEQLCERDQFIQSLQPQLSDRSQHVERQHEGIYQLETRQNELWSEIDRGPKTNAWPA